MMRSAKSDINLERKPQPSILNIEKTGQYLSPLTPNNLIIEEDNNSGSSYTGSDSDRRSPRKSNVGNRSAHRGQSQMSLQVSVAMPDDKSR